MEMKKYSKIFLLCTFSALMTQMLSAKEVLSADFAPTTIRTETDERVMGKNRARGATLDATPDEIKKILEEAADYKKMHPTLKKWVDQNKENYWQLSEDTYILYRDEDVGIDIQLYIAPNSKKKFLFLNRTYFKYPEDAAWQYVQTSAVNPKTKKPWIGLDKKEVQQITKNTKQKFSEADKSYIKDLLSILNENFHFYYGEKFVKMDQVKDLSTLLGKYQPLKVLMYDAFDDFLSPESDQKRDLSKKLGRAVYDLSKGLDNSKMFGVTSNCGDKGTLHLKLKDGQKAKLTYWNQVNPTEINKHFVNRSSQVHLAKYNLEQLSIHLTDLMQEKGVDMDNAKGNTTPLTQALYLINLKMQNYIYAVVTHPYVLESGGKNEFDKKKALYEAVPLPTKLRPVRELKMGMEPVAFHKATSPEMCLRPVHTR